MDAHLNWSHSHATCSLPRVCSWRTRLWRPIPIVPPDAKLEKLFDGGLVLTEGVAVAPDGMVYFSDITFSHVSREEKKPIEAGHIWKFDPKTGKTTIFRSPSGMSNGIKFDADGNMLVGRGRGLRRPPRHAHRHEDRQDVHHRRAVRGPAVQLAQRHHHRREGPHLLQRSALSRPRADRSAGAGRLSHRPRRLDSSHHHRRRQAERRVRSRPIRRRSTS